MNPVLDTSLHERRRAERMCDPEFRAAYEQAAGAIAQTDHIIRTLDEMRAEMGISKAELARQIDRARRKVHDDGRALLDLALVRREDRRRVARLTVVGATVHEL